MNNQEPNVRAWLGAAIYVVLGLAWITGSDTLLAAIVSDPDELTRLQTYKGFVYVLLTALLAYVLLRRMGHAQRRAQANDRMVDDTFEQAGVGIAHLKGDGTVVRVNRRLAELLGLDAEGLAGRDFLALMHPEDAADERRRMQQVARTNGADDVRERRLVRADGSTLWAMLTLAPTVAEAPDERRHILVVQDIGARKEAEAAQRASEARMRQLVRGIPEYVFVKDLEGRYMGCNQALEELFGRSEADIVGCTDEAFFAPERVHFFRAQDQAAIAQGSARRNEEWIDHPDGRRRLLETVKTPLRDSDGRITGLVGVARDITERHAEQQRLRLAATVFENTREGILVTDAQQRIVSVNRAFSDLLGYSEQEVLGQTPRLFQSGRHGRDFYAAMWAQLQAGGHWQGEVWNRRKGGEVFPELLSISAVHDDEQQLTNYVAVFADVSRLKASEAEVQYLVQHDPLTRLPNRLLFESRLDHAVKEAAREGRQVGVLVLDLDRFKDVNDSYGHVVGDEVLRHVAQRLTGRLRAADTLARLSGDEFAVLLDEVKHPEDAARLATALMAALAEPKQLANGVELAIGVSVGISLYPVHGDTALALLQGADAAMYQAKADGRGMYRYFSDELTRTARERLRMEARLRRAIDADQLLLHFQPHVEIASGRITGAEALVRWQDPHDGLVSPARFIPLAEATGLINEIGAWVLAQTCRQGRAWIDAGLPPLMLSANVSARQFHHGDLVGQVRDTLRDTGYPAKWLALELTEGALMERQEEAVITLERLRAMGLRLAIDDFGTGYSSLSYLKRFPLNVLKIDRSFIKDIPDDPDDMAIASTIIAMGHRLGFTVLAEGVETPEQLAFLREEGCDHYQGYLKSRPLPAEEFERLLREDSV